jgi:signal transduction histidine kinase
MNFKRLYLANNLKPIEETAYGADGSSESFNLSVVLSDTEETSENRFLLRLRELEELNTHLENLVRQQSNELAEIVATNTKFLSIIAHDIKSPFSSVLGVLEVLKTSLKDYNKNEIEDYIDIAYNSAIRTLHLLDNLLVWAISQNKEKTFNPVKINLHDLLVDEIENISTSAKQKQIELNHFIAISLNIFADLQMVKTILRNLISNAIKYTNTGGEITISASESKQFIEIGIKDNGVGISFEAQKNLFKTDAFQSTAGTNNEQGTGFGLLLCTEFVGMHGGNIWIESEPGKGSEVKFILPHYI